MSKTNELRLLIFLLFLTMLLVLPGLLFAQQFTVSGYVTEKGSGERLTGAIIYAPARNQGTSSNTFGFYSLTLPADSTELRVSFVGYKPFSVHLTGKGSLSLNVELESMELQEAIVVGHKDALQDKTRMSSIDLPIETIKSLPAFLGEVDIMKSIQLLPGVQAGSEGSSGLYVRGGSPDQNLILLDGVPVYNAYHLFGFFSVFNADAIRNVEVIKGGFPARYGGRLSSVIDLTMKEGDKNQFHGEGGIGLVASRLTLEGPIQKGKSSFMISGRRTYVDVLARPFMSGDVTTGYYFYDLNGKINFRLGRKDHLFLSGYFGNDKFYAKEKQNAGIGDSKFNAGLKWGNATAVARWNHEFGPKLFGNLTAFYTHYNFLISTEMQSRTNGSTDEFLLKYTSGINDKAVRYDFDFIPSPNHYIRFGAGATAHTYTPGAQQVKAQNGNFHEDTTLGNAAIHSVESDVYIEDDIRISQRLKANVGLHATLFSVRDKMYPTIQPRVSARYLLNDQLSLKASYVEMSQFIHLLTNSSIGLPTDLWLPATDKVPAQFSRQGAAGLAYTTKTGLELSAEGYYKSMNNIIEYKEGASFINGSTSWEDKVETGKGN
ncbi:MAG: TonB-dependent receptor, partial [Sphingobacteriales bacterium]